MIIKSIQINKFHGFRNVSFELGQNITIIAGQNGTQKTTLLGLLSQPFSLRIHPSMKDERPLCGGNYWSQYSEKFKISPSFDKVGDHEWTIDSPLENEPYTVESIYRDRAKGIIRFWQKGTREKGSGYLQYPVIYLSLKRLFPIGEENKIHSNGQGLTQEEMNLFKKLHNEILIATDKIIKTEFIEGLNKKTIGITTDRYDWMQNSAGQDNVSKIILSLLSFKRLKEKFKKEYKGGVLLIDELDATMYPGSQKKLLKVLRSYSSNYKIQIIFTTHSLMLLEYGWNMYNETQKNKYTKKQIQLIYLEKKRTGDIEILANASFNTIKNRLKVSIDEEKINKILVYSEDAETIAVARAILRGKRCLSRLSFNKSKFSCNTLIDLMERKIPTFTMPESIILFDGDVSCDQAQQNKLKKIKSHNWVCLPQNKSPERWFAEFIHGLPDNDPFWDSVHPDYTPQLCFRDYTYEDIMGGQEDGRIKAKNWFQQQMQYKKDWCEKVIKRWRNDSNENEEMIGNFVSNFKNVFNQIAKSVSIDQIV